MFFRFFTLSLVTFTALACKTTSSDDPSLSALNALTVETGLLIVGLDGPHDQDEVNRDVGEAAERCFANSKLLCLLAVTAGDLSYKDLSQQCTDHPRCRMFFFRTEDELAALMKVLKPDVKVGLLIGHHTGAGVWDYPTLTLDAFDAIAPYPLVLEIANRGDGDASQAAVVPIGPESYSESDANYVAVVQALLAK